MKNRTLTMLAVSGLVLLMAAPLPAQTIRLAANIPFEFVTGTRTLPAGHYVIDTAAAYSVVLVWNESTREASTALTSSVSEPFVLTTPEAKLIFRRYGNQYFLARIWNGTSANGREIPMSRAERALSAMWRAPETLVILARR